MTEFKPNNTAVLLNLDTPKVATVTLNNPEKHNAFDDSIIATLRATFDYLATRNDIHVVVLEATGKSFSAGADLNWMKRMASYNYQDNLTDANALAGMLHALNFLPQVTIAKVQGAAFGGAVGLVSCCDIAIAAERASFCLSEVKLGLIPATIGPYVVAAIGEKASRRYFTTAERFFAADALQLGLVSEVVSAEQLDESVVNMTNTLLANGPNAIKAAKDLVFSVSNKTIDQQLMADTSQRIAEIRVSEEGQEGLTAFFDKRQPNWPATTKPSSSDQ